MDYVRIPDLAAYVDLAALTDKDWGSFFLCVGRRGADRSASSSPQGKPLLARIDLKDASGGEKDILCATCDGALQVDGQALLLSGFQRGDWVKEGSTGYRAWFH